mmetsp:Transcript_86928/g.241979  ORF Transcript_86928/g.241979 Transcript_86928/m.241979 type:complete len:306 (+) Transcript_86928:476-1393(+)
MLSRAATHSSITADACAEVKHAGRDSSAVRTGPSRNASLQAVRCATLPMLVRASSDCAAAIATRDRTLATLTSRAAIESLLAAGSTSGGDALVRLLLPVTRLPPPSEQPPSDNHASARLSSESRDSRWWCARSRAERGGLGARAGRLGRSTASVPRSSLICTGVRAPARPPLGESCTLISSSVEDVAWPASSRLALALESGCVRGAVARVGEASDTRRRAGFGGDRRRPTPSVLPRRACFTLSVLERRPVALRPTLARRPARTPAQPAGDSSARALMATRSASATSACPARRFLIIAMSSGVFLS